MEKWIENAAYHVEREFSGGRIYPGDRDRIAAGIARHAPAWTDTPTPGKWFGESVITGKMYPMTWTAETLVDGSYGHILAGYRWYGPIPPDPKK